MHHGYTKPEGCFGNTAAPEHPMPPKYKMAIATFLGVFPVVMLVNAVLGPAIERWPLLARTAVTSAVFVVLLTWIVLPLVRRLFRGWLFAGAEENSTAARRRPRNTHAADDSPHSTKGEHSYAD